MILFKEKIKFYSFILLLIFAGISCEEDAPVQVYDPNKPNGATPIITAVEPSDFALIGVTEVRIIGENFSTSTDSINGNKVYFGNKPGTIISASPTEIIVIPPDILGDSLMIKVVVPGALLYAEYHPYKVQSTHSKIEAFNALEQVSAIEVDLQENLYGYVREVSTGIVYKITPSGEKTVYGTSNIPFASDMKFGPGGFLYIQQPNSRDIRRIPPGGGSAEIFTSLPAATDRMFFFDFDQYQNMFSSGNRTGVFVINQAGGSRKVGSFNDFNVKSIRVFNGYVYVLANYTGSNTSFPSLGVWRSLITSSDGDLADPEIAVNLSPLITYNATKSYPLTFSSSGDMYIGTDSPNSLIIVYADGTSEFLYAGYTVPETTQIVWGAGNFIYQNRTNSDASIKGVYKIIVNDTGAPYYGRQ